MRRSRTCLALASAAILALLLSGCVYLRLLELKHQIAAFDRNFFVQTDDGVRIVCRNPVLLAKDVRWLGVAPEKVRKSGAAEQWQVRWVKQLPPGGHENGEFDIIIDMLFAQEKLTRLSIPERYFAVMPKSLLLDLLHSLGSARVDRSSRSVEAQLASARPDLPGIQKLLGRPSSRASKGNETVFRYRYVPATSSGFARTAAFDMAVYFDDSTGQMTRWEGQTPVGRVGFSFEPTKTAAEPAPNPRE